MASLVQLLSCYGRKRGGLPLLFLDSTVAIIMAAKKTE